jgi:arabinogalactan oligomer/maltooligosaccharide transport system permease protein
MMMGKPMLAGTMSTFIWGSGQIYNKQLVKGLFLIALQIMLVTSELVTGSYFTPDFHWRHAGFFGRGLWGAITLGTQARQMTFDGLTDGDHSLMLLIQGLIALMVLCIFILVWVINIKDAVRTAKQFNKTGEIISSKKWLAATWEKSFEYFVLFPAGIMLMFFTFLPLMFSFLVAFTNYNINNLPPAELVSWRGLQNFKFLFAMGDVIGGDIWLHTFIHVFLWTLLQAIIMSIVPFAIGLFQAVVLNNKRIKFKKLWRSLLILPMAVPGMLSLLNFRQVFNGTFGPLNRFLIDHHIIETNIQWLGDTQNIWIPRMTILFIGFWLGFPHWMAMSSGVMTSISKDIYEAAEIDGASERQQFWKITLPLVVASVAPLLIMGFSGAFNNFGLIYFLTGGGPQVTEFIHAGGTDILITWIFSLTMEHRMYNMASVMSIFIFLLIASIAVWQLPKTRAFKEDL